MSQPKIGYCLIEEYQTEKAKVCEAPRHKRKNKQAYAVVALLDETGETLVQIVCQECWKHFDDDMGNPQWRLTENERKNVEI